MMAIGLFFFEKGETKKRQPIASRFPVDLLFRLGYYTDDWRAASGSFNSPLPRWRPFAKSAAVEWLGYLSISCPLCCFLTAIVVSSITNENDCLSLFDCVFRVWWRCVSPCSVGAYRGVSCVLWQQLDRKLTPAASSSPNRENKGKQKNLRNTYISLQEKIYSLHIYLVIRRGGGASVEGCWLWCAAARRRRRRLPLCVFLLGPIASFVTGALFRSPFDTADEEFETSLYFFPLSFLFIFPGIERNIFWLLSSGPQQRIGASLRAKGKKIEVYPSGRPIQLGCFYWFTAHTPSDRSWQTSRLAARRSSKNPFK